MLDFTLPDENSMEAMLFYTSDQPELYHGRNLDAAYDRLAHRYRTQLVHAYDEQSVEASWPRFSGDAFTRAKGYEGPGEGKGNTIVPRSFYGPGKGFDDRDSAWQLVRSLDDVPAREAAEGDHVPLHAGRAEPERLSAHPDAGRQHPLESRARARRCRSS